MFAKSLTISEVSALTSLNVGVDIGNLHARAVWGSSEKERAIIESYVLPVTNPDGLDNVYSCLSSTDANSDWQGSFWVVGHAAIDINPVKGDRVMDTPQGKPRLALPLLVALLWDVLPTSGAAIKLCISVHNKAALESSIKSRLNGSHVFSRDGVKKAFTIEVVEIYSEGVGVIRKERANKSSFLLDLGSDTVIGSAFSGYTLTCNPWAATSFGVRDLIQRVAACEITSRALGRVATFEEIIYSLENPISKGKKLVYQVGKVDVSEAVACEATDWAESVLKMLERNMQSAIVASSSKLATGGGCLIPQVTNALKARGYTIVSDPIWSNVSGLFEICQVKVSKAGAN